MLRRRLFALLLAVVAVFGFTGYSNFTQNALALQISEPAARSSLFSDTVAPELASAQYQTTVPSATSATQLAAASNKASAYSQNAAPEQTSSTVTVSQDGSYDSKDEVALYIHLFGRLPSNYITKKQARALGWRSGSLERYAPGKCIGGDTFANYEGLLPKKRGRRYTECDIDTIGKASRGAKRIVFSNDGLIFYTENHYRTFTQLY